jgi:ESS family glutamate:Na+ symporter
MSLMSLKLWTLADLAGPLSVLLALQLVLALLFAIYSCFQVLGRKRGSGVAGFSSVLVSARRRPQWSI